MSKSKKPTTAERKLQLQEASSRRWDHAVGLPFFVIEKLFSWPGVIIALGYFFFLHGAEHLAGQDTNLFLSAIVRVGSEDWLLWVIIVILLASNVLWALTFRSYVKRKGQREKELELMIDPNRTSSGLSKSGSTTIARTEQ